MKRLWMLLLIPMLLLGSKVDTAELVDVDKVITRAVSQVPSVLDSGKCKMAFRKHFPGYSDDWDLVAGWKEVKIHVVEDIPKMPLARGATQCDISDVTMVIATDYIGWGDQRTVVEVLIHEFVHLVRCSAIVAACGTQANCQPSFIVNEERLAYAISGMCTN